MCERAISGTVVCVTVCSFCSRCILRENSVFVYLIKMFGIRRVRGILCRVVSGMLRLAVFFEEHRLVTDGQTYTDRPELSMGLVYFV